MTVSAVVIAGEEEDMLAPCLERLAFADEVVVVVDAAARDRTEEVARERADKVLVRALEDFAAQKNFGIGHATGDWVLIVDADERIPRALAQEILAVTGDAPRPEVAYSIERLNFFLGRPMRRGGWVESHVRLVRRELARYSGDIHETFVPVAPVGVLRTPMWHFSHRRVEDNLRKTARFGEVQARELVRNGHPPVGLRDLLWAPAREVWRRAIRLRGVRDGTPGLIEAIYQGCSLFCVNVMVWQLQQHPSLPERYRQLEARLDG